MGTTMGTTMGSTRTHTPRAAVLVQQVPRGNCITTAALTEGSTRRFTNWPPKTFRYTTGEGSEASGCGSEG